MNRCTSQFANQPMQKATNRTMAVAIMNSVLFILGAFLIPVCACPVYIFDRLFKAFKGCFLWLDRLGADQLEFNPAVGLAAFLGAVVSDRVTFGIALGGERRGQNPAQAQFVENGARP